MVVTGLHATSFTITMALVGSILGSREPSLLHDDKRMDKKAVPLATLILGKRVHECVMLSFDMGLTELFLHFGCSML